MDGTTWPISWSPSRSDSVTGQVLNIDAGVFFH
jgi:hypothetical protein